MSDQKWLGTILFLSMLLVACNSTPSNKSDVKPTEIIPTEIIPTATQKLTNTPLPTPTKIIPEPPLVFDIPDSEFPFSEPGPYEVSMIDEIIYQDDERNDREISISILFPSNEGTPDLRGAPFPLIINDYKMFDTFGTQLASHGYIVVGINTIEVYLPWDEEVYNQPLDYIFILNELANNPPGALFGFIDSDHTGVWGYSYGGHNSLTLSGARIDPEYYLNTCENPTVSALPFGERSIHNFCDIYENWDQFVEEAGPEQTESDDGLWQAITDDRIQALIALSPEGEWLRGPKGFASADKPIIVTAGSLEGIRYNECYTIFEELGSSEKIFVTFRGKMHNMVFSDSAQQQMRHLAVAYFSFYLKGAEEYGYYFSEDYISETDGLAWGWYGN